MADGWTAHIYSIFPFTPEAGNPVSSHPTPILFPNTLLYPPQPGIDWDRRSFSNVCSLLAPAGSLGNNRFPSTVYSLVLSHTLTPRVTNDLGLSEREGTKGTEMEWKANE